MFLLALALAASIEAPPAEFDTGELVRVEYVATARPDIVCRALLGDDKQTASYMGCYVPAMRTIVLPTWGDPKWRAALKRHEEAHARGWRHGQKE